VKKTQLSGPHTVAFLTFDAALTAVDLWIEVEERMLNTLLSDSNSFL
jgi:hypothetical protein